MSLRFTLIAAILIISLNGMAQDTGFNVYNPEADANKELNEAVEQARKSNKHVFIQVGGNWCKWCRMFYKWSHENATIDSLIKADYVVVHSNYSRENKNPELMKRLGFPQRFGFPVFLIVDGQGNRLHTQNTGYLEEGEGYSEKKVAEFLNQWKPSSLEEDQYK